MKIKILFEDDYIIIINKPAHVLIHNSYYARNIKAPTLLDYLKEELNQDFYPIHRLDRKTSGVLALAKEKQYVAEFQELFNKNEINKIYIAIVRGFVNSKIVIESPVKNPDTKAYKDAETLCEPILEKELNIPVHPYETSRYSLVKLTPKTGRMHQLRIHMNKISNPIVGDYKYGDRFHNRMFESKFNCNNLLLHASTLEFVHPKTAKNIEIKADFPEYWIEILNFFKWKI